jgi:hypothetical protein
MKSDIRDILKRLPKARFSRPRIFCVDGFSISVQDNVAFAYAGEDSTELVFPSEKDEGIMPYAQSAHVPTDTVYPWVPDRVTNDLLDRHGGVDWKKTNEEAKKLF